MKKIRPWPTLVAVVLLALAAAGLYARHVARRALPVTSGTLKAPGLRGRVEVLRDRWGVPHIFADEDDDAAFALGYVHAQDRLFQMELTRMASQGRLAEMFGRRALRVDRLFRTLDLHGSARRALERASPRARSALRAYAAGVNAWVTQLDGRLPPEFALLGRAFEPVREDDFVGVLGTMTWGLNLSFTFDPLFERLSERLGRERALTLFPWNFGGAPAVHAAPEVNPGAALERARPGGAGTGSAFLSPFVGAPGPRATAAHAEAARALARLTLSRDEEELLSVVPQLRASNNWVVGPARSASGHALLANDPHLAHGMPGIWYQAHLKSRTQDVIGVTLPGLPLVVIGHNQDIAWGFTNVMLDAADFFVERLDPARPDEVMFEGRWVPLARREETLKVRGEEPERLTVRETPHGPLVSDLVGRELREADQPPPPLPGGAPALSYRWTYLADRRATDLDGFLELNRARDWTTFRAALSRFGATAQNVAYADRAGHIGLQTAGSIPRLHGTPDGSGFRRGWDGSEEWDGFVPFEQNPWTFDPPEGLLSSANNPTLPPGAPYYISSQWEPTDRIVRIREVLAAKPKLSVADMQALHVDTTLVSARDYLPLLVAEWDRAPVRDARVSAALELLRAWDGDMRSESPAPTLFAHFYRRLFYALFEDELGSELARDYRRKANISSIMMRAALVGGAAGFVDDTRTAGREERGAILMRAFLDALAEVRAARGDDPAGWAWGRVHTLELRHPLSRASRLLGFYFNRGPVPVPGHNSTVNKMEYDEEDFRVIHGPSMRQVTDLGDLDNALAVIPAGQSGLPASPHYDDLRPLWLGGRYHPFPLSREAVEREVAARLVLEP